MNTIEKLNFNLGISQESHIWSPVYCLIHYLVAFSINHKKHHDKVTKLSLFYLWSILAPRVFCKIPYFLAKYFGQKVVSYKIGIPIAGGNFVTLLAKSYGVFITGMTHTLTCIEGNDLPMSYLELTRVVVNLGGVCGIPPDDEVRPMENVEEKGQRGRRIVRVKGGRAQPNLKTYP